MVGFYQTRYEMFEKHRNDLREYALLIKHVSKYVLVVNSWTKSKRLLRSGGGR